MEESVVGSVYEKVGEMEQRWQLKISSISFQYSAGLARNHDRAPQISK